jgi:hypothetical protein
MNEGLFQKYAKVLTQKKNEKDEIIMFLEKETGGIFASEELVIQKNKISFQISSVKKVLLKKKSIQDFLKQKGYTVQ